MVEIPKKTHVAPFECETAQTRPLKNKDALKIWSHV